MKSSLFTILHTKELAGVMLLIVSLFLAACSPSKLTQSLAQVDKSWYQLTDNYADHRAHQSYFNTKVGRLAYLDLSAQSDQPVLVLLHGVPSSSWLYRKMLPDLQQHYRVIAVDLMGYGSSDKPDSDGVLYHPQAQANYVQDLLISLGVSDYSLAFHDMGGLVAWELIDRDLSGNQKIKNLFVLNTIISKHGFNHPNIKKGAAARAMSNVFSSAVTSSTALEMTFDNMGLSSKVELSEQECNGYVAPMREGSNQALYDFYTGFDETLFYKLESRIQGLSRFTGKVYVFWGAQDKVLTTAQIPVLESALSEEQIKTIIYETNAHFLPEEIPAKLSLAFIGAK